MAKQEERWFCGCCGGRLESQGDVWCRPCSKHVRGGWRMWEATYFAQHSRICPFDVNLPPGVRERNLLEAK